MTGRTKKKVKRVSLFESFDHYDRERFAIWDKSDWHNVSIVFQKLRNQNKFLDDLNEMLFMARKADDPERGYLYCKFKMSRDEKSHVLNLLNMYRKQFFSLLYWWENSLERTYADQTCYWFDTQEKFEPLQVEIITNKITARGLRLCAEYMTGQSAAYPKHIGLGTNGTKVKADDQKLLNEIHRDLADYYNANGNIISSGKLFSENVVDGIIAEVGGYTGSTETADLVWRSVIDDVSKRIDHDVGVDRPSASHSLYLTSR